MKGLYLLGFVRDCYRVPGIKGFSIELTKKGRNGIVWCNSPVELFSTKQEFMGAMLELFRKLLPQSVFIPIQLGTRVMQKGDLVELIRKYEEDLERSFQKVADGWEYDVQIALPKKQDFNKFEHTCSSEDMRSGKDYLQFIKLRQEQREQESRQVAEILRAFSSRLAPWIADWRTEASLAGRREIYLAFLVKSTYEQKFRKELEIISTEIKESFDWTGPWPPFHFTDLILRPESFLVRESLNWERRGSDDDRVYG